MILNNIQRSQSLPKLNQLAEIAGPKTNIERLGEAFEKVNPYLGTNPKGTCQPTSFEVAKSLVNGTKPQKADLFLHDEEIVQGYDDHMINLSNPGKRREEALQHLRQAPNGTVFIVDAPGHNYNIIKDDVGGLFLFDAAFAIYKKIENPEDFNQTIWPQEVDSKETVDYTSLCSPSKSPDEDSHEETKTSIFIYGSLHSRWAVALKEEPVVQKPEHPQEV